MKRIELDLVTHACNPRNWEPEVGGLPLVPGQPGLRIELSASLNYSVRLVLKQIQRQKQQNKKEKGIEMCYVHIPTSRDGCNHMYCKCSSNKLKKTFCGESIASITLALTSH